MLPPGQAAAMPALPPQVDARGSGAKAPSPLRKPDVRGVGQRGDSESSSWWYLTSFTALGLSISLVEGGGAGPQEA